MTRLLVPEMFGVMAIAMMVMYGLALFSDVGLRQSIVQSRRGGEAVFLNTAWALQIMRGFVIWGAALAVAALPQFTYVSDLEPSARWYGRNADVIKLTMGKDGRMAEFIRQRYGSWDSGIGTQIVSGKAGFRELEAYMLKKGDATPNVSGRQEFLENLINEFI